MRRKEIVDLPFASLEAAARAHAQFETAGWAMEAKEPVPFVLADGTPAWSVKGYRYAV